MRPALALALLATTLACSVFAVPAQAQRARVFVASYGSDSNPCTFGSPCKTFQAAVNAVAAGGEVTAIDSAGFLPVTISKSVTITSPAGTEAGIAAAPGNNAITIESGAGTVVLRGLTIDGGGTANYGIVAIAGNDVEIYDCAVHNFATAGIEMSAVSAMNVVISNTVVSGVNNNDPNNPNLGIDLATNGGTITATLDKVTADYNNYGLQAYAFNGNLQLLISNSHIDNSSGLALAVAGSGSNSQSSVTLKNVTLNQSPVGIFEDGFSTVWLSHVTQSTVAGFTTEGGLVYQMTNNLTYGDGTNHIMGSLGGGAAITSWPATF